MNYGTTFPLTQNPITENGIWLGGATVGLDWHDMRTTGNSLAFGTQLGTETGSARFSDSLAIHSGIWGPNQTITFRVVNNIGAGGDWAAEVEAFLHFTLGAHSATGIEVNFACNPGRLGTGANDYCTIVQWLGALGSFNTLQTQHPGAVHNGDIITVSYIGNVITGSVNGSQVITATDSTFPTGSVGFGHFFSNGTQTGDATKWGLGAWSATDGNNPIAAHTRVTP